MGDLIATGSNDKAVRLMHYDGDAEGVTGRREWEIRGYLISLFYSWNSEQHKKHF